jgi:hypothetical protein
MTAAQILYTIACVVIVSIAVLITRDFTRGD